MWRQKPSDGEQSLEENLHEEPGAATLDRLRVAMGGNEGGPVFTPLGAFMQRLAGPELCAKYNVARTKHFDPDSLIERSEEEWRHECMKISTRLWRRDGRAVPVQGMTAGGRGRRSTQSEWEGEAFLLDVIEEFETGDAALEAMAHYQAAGMECVFLPWPSKWMRVMRSLGWTHGHGD